MMGGWVDATSSVLDSLLRYDTTKDSWRNAGKLSHAMMTAASVAYNSCVYVFGEYTDSTHAAKACVVQQYSTAHRTCSARPMPRTRGAIRSVLWENKAVITGSHACLLYNLATGE